MKKIHFSYSASVSLESKSNAWLRLQVKKPPLIVTIVPSECCGFAVLSPMCLQTGRLLSKYVFILIKTELSIAFYIYLLSFLLLDSFKIKKNHDLEMHIKRAYPTTCMCAYMCWHMCIYYWKTHKTLKTVTIDIEKCSFCKGLLFA